MLPTVLKTPSSPLWTRRRLSNAPSIRRLSNAPSIRRRDSLARPATPTVSTNFSFDEYDDNLNSMAIEPPPPPQNIATLISPATTILRTRAGSANCGQMRRVEPITWTPNTTSNPCPQQSVWFANNTNSYLSESDGGIVSSATIRRPVSAMDAGRYGHGGIPASLLQKQSYSFSPSTIRRRFSLGQANRCCFSRMQNRSGYRRRQPIGNFWRSFEMYTDLPPAGERQNSLIRKRLLENAMQEEKTNGDVRFDVSETDGNGAKRNNSTAKNIRRRQSGYGITITSDSTAKMRCRQRKQLFQRRNKVCDLSLILGLLGLILVVIDTELTAQNFINKFSFVSLAIRTLVVSSTLALICTLINYHRIEVKIALIDSGADDWRVALTTERIIKLGIEVTVCSICPFPGSGDMHWACFRPNQKIESVQVPLDVMLAIPMYLRAYLLCRFMVLHSRQFQDAATRSIAALNRISMDFRFVIKTMMAEHPLTVLVVFTVSYWLCMSWTFTQCERHYDVNKNLYNNVNFPPQHYYMNSLWFIIVTFMSIGYGDLVPTTHCGRMLAITTGIVGAGVSSALIAVISRKLELSRAEKHVNNFMADSKLTNQRKNAAASVLQHTWFIHRYQRTTNKGDDLRLRQHQRKFLNAINEFRRIKWDQRKLQEKGNSLLDVGKLHGEMHETLWEMHKTQDQFIAQIDMLTQRIMELQAVVLGQQQQQLNTTSPQSGNQQQTGGQQPNLGNLSPQGHQFQQPTSPLASHHYNPYHFHPPRASSPQYQQQQQKRTTSNQQPMPTTAITIGDPPTSCFITSVGNTIVQQNRNGLPSGQQHDQRPICGNGGLVHQQRSLETPTPKLSQVTTSDLDFDMDEHDDASATSPLIDKNPPV